MRTTLPRPADRHPPIGRGWRSGNTIRRPSVSMSLRKTLKPLRLSCFICLLFFSSARVPLPATQAQSSALFDQLILGHIFYAKPINIQINEPRISTRRELTRDTFWADTIAGGIKPKHQRYFMFRPASDAKRDSFEIVFFDDDAQGFFVKIKRDTVVKMDDTEIVLERVANYGGEAGMITEKRDFRFTERLNSAGNQELGISISSESVRRTAARLYVADKANWDANMWFTDAIVSESLVAAAKSIAIDLHEFNRLENLAKGRK